MRDTWRAETKAGLDANGFGAYGKGREGIHTTTATPPRPQHPDLHLQSLTHRSTPPRTEKSSSPSGTVPESTSLVYEPSNPSSRT